MRRDCSRILSKFEKKQMLIHLSTLGAAKPVTDKFDGPSIVMAHLVS